MTRGPMVAFAPPNETPGGGQDDDDPGDENGDPGDSEETVPKAAHDALVRNHEKLKKDSRVDRQKIRDLEKDLSDAKAELDAEKAKHDGDTDVATKLQTQRETLTADFTKKLTEAQATIAKKDEALDEAAKERELDRQMDEIRVKPELRRGARAILGGLIEVERDEDETRVCLMDSLPLPEAMKAWAVTEEGKVYTLAADSGGGANGGGRSTAGKNPWKTAQWNMTEQGRLENTDPRLAARLKAEAGVA
jgi:hypothetical protein